MGARVAEGAESMAGCRVQSGRAQPVPDFWKVRDVLCAGRGDEGEGDGVGESKSTAVQIVESALS